MTNERISELINDLQMIVREKNDLEESEKAIRSELFDLFGENQIEKMTAHGATVSVIPEKIYRKVDSNRLKEELPDVYEKYSYEATTAAHLNVRVK
ncbi:hypothetical protein [Methanolapillus millepedarum]|uniref:Uncharacterized protein n=1 Tax=Methanolapillus millepedarum TaxID=3028296 RepID=A0AA96ZV11_9EURY|nr:hypothetical protein MsAc7_17820 [Methanosarcinaceae archaeon Ac7]